MNGWIDGWMNGDSHQLFTSAMNEADSRLPMRRAGLETAESLNKGITLDWTFAAFDHVQYSHTDC